MTEESEQRISENSVLGVLAIRTNITGYQVRKWILETVSRFWEIKDDEIHALLEQLVARGLVQTSSRSPNSKPSRTPPESSKTDEVAEQRSVQRVDWDGQIYSLTSAGYTEFEKWLSEPPVTQGARNEFLLKVLFAARGKTEYVVRHIEAFRQYQVEALKLNGMAGLFLKGSAFVRMSPDLPYWILANKYGKHLYNAMKDWSEAALSDLKDLHKTR
jgi:DNA-binding PadR family transcriptional regulator